MFKVAPLTQTPMSWPLRPPLASLQSVFRWVCQTHIMQEEAGTATQEPSAELNAQCLAGDTRVIVWMWTSVEREGFSWLGKRANTLRVCVSPLPCSWYIDGMVTVSGTPRWVYVFMTFILTSTTQTWAQSEGNGSTTHNTSGALFPVRTRTWGSIYLFF